MKGWEKEMWKFCLHEQRRNGDVEWDENSVVSRFRGKRLNSFL